VFAAGCAVFVPLGLWPVAASWVNPNFLVADDRSDEESISHCECNGDVSLVEYAVTMLVVVIVALHIHTAALGTLIMARFRFRLLVMALFLASLQSALATTMWYVNGVSGNDKNNCTSPQTACKTIVHAIALAGPGDSITVAPAIYHENLTINISLSIIGSGARSTIIDGGGIAGVVAIFGAANVIVSKVTIRNGFAIYGAGVFNEGELTINASAVVNNKAGNGTNGAGGGIYNSGTLRLNASTVNGNSVIGRNAYGGGIFSSSNVATVSLNNSTISGNSSAGTGGGIESYCCLATINNSTIVGNNASGSGGGGIYIVNTGRIQNSILANNGPAGNCYGSVVSDGYNLSSDDTCHFSGSGDLNNVEPELGSLRNNGGPTNTMAELLGSPTVDGGNPNGCTDDKGRPLTRDQRGEPRPGKYKKDKRCDMGACERQTD